MPGFDVKPTAEHVTQQVTYLKKVWRETHSQWEVYDTFYDRTFEVWEPGSDRPVVHPAKPKSIVDTGVDQMMGHSPKFERFPQNAARQDEADSGEKALASMFRQMSEFESSLTLEEVKKNLLLYGYAVLEDSIDSTDLAFHRKPKPVRERGEEDEEFKRRVALWSHKRKTLMPFRNRAPHPSDVLIDPSHKNPRIAIKIAQWYAGDLYELTKSRISEGGESVRGDVIQYESMEGDDPFKLVEAYDYWTEDWHALMTAENNTLLIVEPNTWGFVPFSHAFAGFGHQPTNANRRDTKYLAVGMLDSIMDDLLTDARMASGKLNASVEAMFVKQGTTEEPSEIAEQEANSDIIQLQNRGSLWFLEQPTLPNWLQHVGVDNDKDMEEATYSRGLGGIKDVGVSTVGQQAILNTAGHRRFLAPTQQVNQLFTKSAEHFLQLIDILDLDLTIEGHQINRRIIDGDYAVKVTFTVVDPVLQLQERQQALTEVQQGVMDLPTFWGVAGRGDVTGARERLWEDQVYAHPTIQEMFVKLKAKELGLEKLLEEEPDVHAAGPRNAPPRSNILGPDGQPLESTLGTGNLRAPLTPDVAKPSQTGQNLAG